jgi:MFS family permease
VSAVVERPVETRSASVRTVLAASLVGTTVEWYDFFLYATAAGLVFPKLFFPVGNETAATLLAFGTFAVGFVARPIGGVLFGHIGDRLGRKRTLVATMLLMGVATALIGLLPPVSVIGVAAPVLLVVLRVLQGLAVGGEWGGAVLLAVENAPPGRRGCSAASRRSGSGSAWHSARVCSRCSGGHWIRRRSRRSAGASPSCSASSSSSSGCWCGCGCWKPRNSQRCASGAAP